MTLQHIIEELENIIDQASNDEEIEKDAIMEDLIESPHHRITRLEIEKCNKLYRKYNK